MILIISWPVVLFLVGIWAVLSAICAVIYGIQSSWDDEKVKWLRTFTIKQKWGLFALLMGIFGSVAAFICSFIYHIPILGLFSSLSWVAFSLVAAYLCSPLKWNWGSAVNVLGVIASLASLVVVVAFSWIFILIALFRKSTWRLYVGIVLALLVIMATMLCVGAYQVGGWDKFVEKPVIKPSVGSWEQRASAL